MLFYLNMVFMQPVCCLEQLVTLAYVSKIAAGLGLSP